MRGRLGSVEDGADLQVDLAGGVLAPGVVVGPAAGQEWAAAFVLVADAAEPWGSCRTRSTILRAIWVARWRSLVQPSETSP